MNDPMLKIAVCNHRNNSKYKNQEKPWSYIKDRNRRPIRTTETAEEYPRLPKEKRDELKDHGGFVGGWLKGGIRKNGNVISRCIGALDADNIGPDDDFLGITRKALEGVEYFIYSTHKHRPEAPRYRIVILFDREVSEDEYPALMRMVARQIGMDFFDDSTYQSNRMMYWSSCPSNGVFFFEEGIGEPMAVDRYLRMYADWRDTTQWPTSSRQSEVVKHSVRQQQDPLSKDGLIGAFCRTYFPITEAIHTFLSDVYAPSAVEGRYDYIPADSNAGVVVYDDKFVYSHHATDPACEKLLNAFDLVRIHLFGDDDPKKTYKQMCDLALQQDVVKLTLDRERRERADEDFAADDDRDWTSQLRYQPRSQILENSVWNLMLILNNDPDFANFGYNELASRVQVTGPVPWDRPADNKFWRDADTAQLKALLDTRYVSFSSRNHDVCFAKVADDRRFHPIRDYLDSLPPWDGECRVESLFIRCLEADDTEYVRTVTRRLFAAAVARVYQPGIKFDCLTVIDGAQGIGKSTLLKELVGDEYYSETLSLTDMDDKTGAEKLQGYWVIEIGELAGMKKADVEKVKGFLSTTDDKYRPSYFYYNGEEIPVNVVPAEKLTAETLIAYDTDGTLHVIITPEVGSEEAVEENQASYESTPLDNTIFRGLSTSVHDSVTDINEAAAALGEYKAQVDALKESGVDTAMNGMDQAFRNQQSEVVGMIDDLTNRQDDLETVSNLALNLWQALSSGDLDADTAAEYAAQLQEILDLVSAADEYIGVGNELSSSIAQGMQEYGWEGDASTLAASLQTAIAGVMPQVGTDASAGVGQGVGEYDFSGDTGNAADNLEGAYRGSLQSQSPAQCMVPLGNDVSAGVGQGMTQYSFAGDSATAASNLMSALSAALAAQASTAAASARAIGTAISSGIASGISAGQSGVISAAVRVAQAAISAAKSALAVLIDTNLNAPAILARFVFLSHEYTPFVLSLTVYGKRP